ncbi:unnamed protein product [Oncorhynchus mykiss]|uniref:Uncharacterized protein n=1 Tax=Oncorhynchus mykiss TaxID=8022 RepID=A0A060YZE1_ONCMY|nr:unnamed protein product [Oncorhynchus mykiss]
METQSRQGTHVSTRYRRDFRVDQCLHYKWDSVPSHFLVCLQDALAPYQHIEEDLKSLKEVLLMKNQQIHEQDVKISELERMVGSK